MIFVHDFFSFMEDGSPAADMIVQGLVITSLNLLSLGRLDGAATLLGGRRLLHLRDVLEKTPVMAIYGKNRKNLGRIGRLLEANRKIQNISSCRWTYHEHLMISWTFLVLISYLNCKTTVFLCEPDDALTRAGRFWPHQQLSGFQNFTGFPRFQNISPYQPQIDNTWLLDREVAPKIVINSHDPYHLDKQNWCFLNLRWTNMISNEWWYLPCIGHIYIYICHI